QKDRLDTYQQENLALRGILIVRGIPFEDELDHRKAVTALRLKRDGNLLSPSSILGSTPPSMGTPSPQQVPGQPDLAVPTTTPCMPPDCSDATDTTGERGFLELLQNDFIPYHGVSRVVP
ncbi:hypothetical protein LTR72_011567, partial [Exophiala xenobiotica]